jgi:hypothetical protein
VLGVGTGRLQALVHDGDGDIELIDDIGRDATVLRLVDDAGNPNVADRLRLLMPRGMIVLRCGACR